MACKDCKQAVHSIDYKLWAKNQIKMLKNIISDKNYGLKIQDIPSATIHLKYIAFKPQFDPKVVPISSSQRRFSGKRFLSSLTIDKCVESPKIVFYDISKRAILICCSLLNHYE